MAKNTRSGSKAASNQPSSRQRRQARSVTYQKHQRWKYWPWAAGVVVVAGAIVAAVLLSGGGGSSVPAGTKSFAETTHSHVNGPVTYDRTPPAGGAHNAVWLNCGIYDQPVANENAVHSLEHGAVWITYRPDLPADQVAQLRQLVSSHYSGDQRYLLLTPYPGLSSPIVASAWGAQLAVQQPTDARLLQFIQHFEGGGQGGEAGAACSAGTGTPVG
jgi:hypothetical protein